jgi:hypothetical protein
MSAPRLIIGALERRRANKQALQGLAACYHVSAFSIVCVDFRVSWQKTSFAELGLDARFARRAHQLGSRSVVLPVDADIIVYLLVLADHTSAVPTLTQSLAEALATP